MQTTTPDTGLTPENAQPDPTLAAKVASAVAVLLVVISIWRIVEIRNSPPPPPAENYQRLSR